MEKYIEFKKVLLEQTGIVGGNPKRMVAYKKLSDQNIKTLYDLFTRYDLNTINYGNDTKALGAFEKSETQGIVNLLRYKYLNELFSFDPLTNLSEMVRGKHRNILMQYLQSIGLPNRASLYSYFWINEQYEQTITVIDLLKQLKTNMVYVGTYPSCFQKTLNEKVRLLIEFSEQILKNQQTKTERKMMEPMNRWFEIMEPSEVQAYHEYKYEEVKEAFNKIDWLSYNSVVLLDDEDFETYVKLQKKIKMKSISKNI